MTPIQIQQLNPNANNRRTEFAKSPLTFGREANCDIIIAQDYVSRQHGQLQFDAGQWMLTNNSPNGTEVNGKRITKKPIRLKNGDSISIGGNLVMRITLAKPTTIHTEDSATHTSDNELTPSAKKKKLWMFIGIYFAMIILLFLFLSTLKKEDKKTNDLPIELSARQIEDEIYSPIKHLPPNPRLSSEQLRYATEAYNQRDVEYDALYVALHAYRKSLAYSQQDAFSSSLDQNRFLDVRQQLTDQLTSQYQKAYNQLRNRNYQQAVRSFRNLARIYPVNDRRKSKVFANIEDLIQTSNKLNRK